MANIFEQYGIKEVADVMIYKLEEKNGQTTEVPFLYLDTLKVSTLEQTAEQTEARGGKGNSPLIIWDFGKEINITLEDALYSPRSMSLMWGGGKDWVGSGDWKDSKNTVKKTVAVVATSSTAPKVEIYDPNTQKNIEITSTITYTDEKGDTPTTYTAGQTYFATFELNVTGHKLEIDADDFPGTYKIVGDTYARNRDTGKDEFFQFIINRAKMSAENTLTLEAEGDPTVFNLNLRTLRPREGNMIELIQYQLNETASTNEQGE